MTDLHIASLIHTASKRVATICGVITSPHITEVELIAHIKRAVGTSVIVSHYPHTVTHTDTGIRVDLIGCRYHIMARHG